MSIYQDALNFFGIEKQKMKAIEESSELIRAISRNDRENIIEEIVDNLVMFEQLKLMYHISEEDIQRVLKYKIFRLETILKHTTDKE